ncbi:MAG: ABC transporter permease, partial [Janthinobacterium lividum]
MPALSFGTTARIATRELRSSRGKFAFVVLSVAIGVAALTGVRGFSAAFRSMLLLRARTIMAADLSVHSSQALTAADTAKLNRIVVQSGAQQTPVTEILSMASASTSLDPLLVSLKAVDPAHYPFYGTVTLSPAMPLPQALTDTSVAVADDLLLRLHLHVGDAIRLNDKTFRIAATIVEEPDRLAGAFAAGPRILISQHALEMTGLLGFGSRATRRVLLLLPQPSPGKAAADATVSKLKEQLQEALPEAGVSDFRDANEGLTRALDGATGLLSLMSLVALVLGAIGVAMAIRAHLAQRLDSIAIMKALGAGSGTIIRIYVLQTLLLGLCGGVLGLLLGFGVQLVLPLFLARLLHLTPAFHLDPHALLLGISAGLLTTLLFSLPPLLDIRDVRPILILRRAVESSDDPFAQRLARKVRSSATQIVAFVVILAGLMALAAYVSESRQIGSIFGVGLAGVLLVLLALATALLAALRVLLRRSSLHLPPVLRHGLANLYRPGNPSAALLAALGLGIMQ